MESLTRTSKEVAREQVQSERDLSPRKRERFKRIYLKIKIKRI